MWNSYLLFFTMIFFPSIHPLQAQDLRTFLCSAEVIDGKKQKIFNEMNQKDVSAAVDNFKLTLATCELNNGPFSLNDNVFNMWKQKGYKAEIKIIKNRIESDSFYYAPNKNDTDAYRKFSQLSGVSDKNIDEFLNKAHQRGVAAQTAAEKSCSAVDLRDKMGPVRNQDSMGYCYAFAAADLVSYKLGKRISAMDLSISYNDNFFDNRDRFLGKKEADIDGGFSSEAIDRTLKKGFCLEENLKSDDIEFSSLKAAIRQSAIMREKYLKDGDLCEECIIGVSGLKAQFTGLDYKSVVEVLESSNKMNYFIKLADKSCAPRIKSQLKMQTYRNKRDADGLERKKLMQKLSEQMSLKNPTEIIWNTAIRYDKQVRDARNTDHSSLIVGRKWNLETKKCDYLLRDSNGRQCIGEFKCEEGNYWIPEDILGGNIIEVAYAE